MEQIEKESIFRMDSVLMNSEYLTVAQIQELLSISPASAYRLVERAEFPVLRLCGSIRIPKKPFFDWLNERTAIPADATV